MKTSILLMFCTLMMVSCTKYNIFGTKLGGTQSPMGETYNTFAATDVPGVSSMSAVITGLEDGVTSVTFAADISDPILRQLATGISDASVSGQVVTREGKYRFTSEGIESVYDEGSLIVVKYSDDVGAKYTLKRGNTTIKREVTSKSTTDDYFWGFMLIKVMTIEETGRNEPGVSKIEYAANHRFGIVGVKVFFEDGTTRNIGVFSDKTND